MRDGGCVADVLVLPQVCKLRHASGPRSVDVFSIVI